MYIHYMHRVSFTMHPQPQSTKNSRRKLRLCAGRCDSTWQIMSARHGDAMCQTWENPW